MTNATDAAPTIRGIVTKRALPDEYGISAQTAWRLEKTDPEFPRRVLLTDDRVGWWRHELDAYFLARPRAKPHARRAVE